MPEVANMPLPTKLLRAGCAGHGADLRRPDERHGVRHGRPARRPGGRGGRPARRWSAPATTSCSTCPTAGWTSTSPPRSSQPASPPQRRRGLRRARPAAGKALCRPRHAGRHRRGPGLPGRLQRRRGEPVSPTDGGTEVDMSDFDGPGSGGHRRRQSGIGAATAELLADRGAPGSPSSTATSPTSTRGRSLAVRLRRHRRRPRWTQRSTGCRPSSAGSTSW